MEKCEYCHIKFCTPERCLCDVLDTGEFFSCKNCARVQNNLIYPNYFFCDKNLDQPKNKNQSDFLEFTQKLNLPDYIGNLASEKFFEFKKKLRFLNSTKNNEIISIHCLLIACEKHNIAINTKKIFLLFNTKYLDYVKMQKFLLSKNIDLEISHSEEKKCDSLFLKLEVFCPILRKKLIFQSIEILKKSDYKIETVVSSIFILTKILTSDKKNIKFFSKKCSEILGVKLYSIKKIILKFYKIKF